MSMEEWGIIGYGICTDVIETDVIRIERLLDCAPKFKKKIKQDFEANGIDFPDLEDYLEYDTSYEMGLAYLMQEVIREAENINVECFRDGYEDCYLLFHAYYPWDYKHNRVRAMSEEDMRYIFQHYTKILTGELVDVQYVNTTNFG